MGATLGATFEKNASTASIHAPCRGPLDSCRRTIEAAKVSAASTAHRGRCRWSAASTASSCGAVRSSRDRRPAAAGIESIAAGHASGAPMCGTKPMRRPSAPWKVCNVPRTSAALAPPTNAAKRRVPKTRPNARPQRPLRREGINNPHIASDANFRLHSLRCNRSLLTSLCVDVMDRIRDFTC